MKKLRHFLPTIGASIGVLVFAAAAAAAPGLVKAEEKTDLDLPGVALENGVGLQAEGTEGTELPELPEVETPEVETPEVETPEIEPADTGDDDEAKAEGEEGEKKANHGACVSYWAKQSKGLKGKGKSFVSVIAKTPTATMVKGEAPGSDCDFSSELDDLKAKAEATKSKAGKSGKAKTHTPDDSDDEESGS